MVPGHQAMAGSRWPPSHTWPLKPRSGLFEPRGHAPLSEKKNTSVRSASPSSRSFATMAPSPSSIAFIIWR